jgi:hypothetical protein
MIVSGDTRDDPATYTVEVALVEVFQPVIDTQEP